MRPVDRCMLFLALPSLLNLPAVDANPFASRRHALLCSVMLTGKASRGLEQLAELLAQGKLKVHLDRWVLSCRPCLCWAAAPR
jgi:hypothetical protein